MWTLALALGAGLAVWVAAFLAVDVAGQPQAFDNPAGFGYLASSAAAYLAMAAVLAARLPRLSGAPLRDVIRPLGRRDAATAGIACLIVVALRMLTFGYLFAIGQPGHVQAGLGGFRTTGVLASALTIAVGALIAPVSEELLYRGTIYGALARRLPATRAAAVSGLIFAAARFDLVLAPFFVLYGTLLAVIYRRTGNLLVPITVRAIFDGASYALLVWLDAVAAP